MKYSVELSSQFTCQIQFHFQWQKILFQTLQVETNLY